MLTLEERIRNFNAALAGLEQRYGLRLSVELSPTPVTRGTVKAMEVAANPILLPIEGWVEPVPSLPTAVDAALGLHRVSSDPPAAAEPAQ